LGIGEWEGVVDGYGRKLHSRKVPHRGHFEGVISMVSNDAAEAARTCLFPSPVITFPHILCKRSDADGVFACAGVLQPANEILFIE
jgi:hypothetical protein